MVAIRIPNTDRIIFLPDNVGDVVLNLENYPEIDDAIQNEDIPVIGDWEDYTGSGEAEKGEVPLQGSQDQKEGSVRSELEGDEVERTDRGNKQATTRERPRLVTVET